MKDELLSAFSFLDEALVNSQSEDNSFRILCMHSANMFENPDSVFTRVNHNKPGVLFEGGKQRKAFFSIPFEIDKNRYFFEIFFEEDRVNSIRKDDMIIFEKLAKIISKRIGKVDEEVMNQFDTCIHYKDTLTPKELRAKRGLDEFLFENFYQRDILYDLMPFKVKEILLIASLYDAFTIENEGNFTQKILGEFFRLNLTTFPRVTAVSYYYDAFQLLCSKHFDLIIVMVGNDKKSPIKAIEALKKDFSQIPVYILLNNNADESEFIDYKLNNIVHNVFIWNGDSRIFFSMIKLLEDRVNLNNDTKIGHSRIILLVEDTPRFYSRYLPELYLIIFGQTRNVMEHVNETDEMYKVLSVRVRPKILLASTYEEAIAIFEKHKDNFLSLITDVEFYRKGKKDVNAGIDLAQYVQKQTPDIDIPIVVQSRDIENKKKADKINCSFIYKESQTLAHDINRVVKYNMGFGNFIYKDGKGNNTGYVAKNLDDFEYYLEKISDESLMFHALRNHFSIWLMARGEIRFAEVLARLRSEDFESTEHIRKFLLKTVKRLRYEKTKGKVVEFNANELDNQSTVVTLSSGALGGKGRGLVFINKLVYGFGIDKKFEGINIKTPTTYIIGTDTYDEFIETNNLREIIFNKNISYQGLKEAFLDSWLSEELVEKLRVIVRVMRNPFAVRSSGLFEDSLMQPFAGVFETYIIPNSNKNYEARLRQLIDAIKLVYASVFSPISRAYIDAIDYKIDEEKMAVVIQEVVGNKYDKYYYPHISGTAQSYNYYPFLYIKPEDGISTLALGLGSYVVGGDRAFHFSPKYPKLLNCSLKSLVNNSQVYFYAVDLSRITLNLLDGENAGLKKLDLWDAEKHGTLKHLASVYNSNNNTLIAGIEKNGPRVLDFANILKHNYIPLAETINELLEVVADAMGSPVEIEFAIDLNKDDDFKASFYLLQIKPLIGNVQAYEIEEEELNKEELLFFTNKGMGNGIIDTIEDVIYVVPEKFNKSRTEEMATEFEILNKKMQKKGRKYILVAPGRLGTRDKWIGVPVVWSQISQAKIIIETSLPHYPLDASAGSHFFHNVVSMNVGYFSIHHDNPDHFLRWDLLEIQEIVYESDYVRHVRFQKPLIVRMDGKKRIAIIEV